MKSFLFFIFGILVTLFFLILTLGSLSAETFFPTPVPLEYEIRIFVHCVESNLSERDVEKCITIQTKEYGKIVLIEIIFSSYIEGWRYIAFKCATLHKKSKKYYNMKFLSKCLRSKIKKWN